MGKKFLCYFRLNCSRVFCQNLGRGPSCPPRARLGFTSGPFRALLLAGCCLRSTPFPSSHLIFWDRNAHHSELSVGELIRITDKQPSVQAVQLRTV